ncbi:MAG: 4Fe-4S dicluster domain-containing protein [Myxococcota bacterium]
MSAPVSRGTVTIARERCKGCELCVPACPPGVLRMSSARNAMGAHYPELLPGCTGCGACLLVCPDFCFEVFRYETPVVHEPESSVRGGAA